MDPFKFAIYSRFFAIEKQAFATKETVGHKKIGLLDGRIDRWVAAVGIAISSRSHLLRVFQETASAIELLALVSRYVLPKFQGGIH